MTPKILYQQKCIDANKAEYKDSYSELKTIKNEELAQLNLKRANLLHSLANTTQTGYKGTKLDVSNMSPGCKLCAEGAWSCLFINNKCNCNCAYCPTPQDTIDEPTTNTLSFKSAKEYANYVAHFGFGGVSISGGEPLLTFSKSMEYLKEVKQRLGDNVHFWMYTNGTLVSSEKLQMLADAGLNEIRFDIGATNYSTEYLKLAIGKIPIVTVEIPLMPDKFELMKQKLAELNDLGVNYLNLHQLRLTPYNLQRLKNRNFTFAHGERMTVVESEIKILELMQFGKEQNICLPFQKVAARQRAASQIVKNHEDVTPNGYIRSLSISGDNAENLIEIFQSQGVDKKRWNYVSSQKKLFFSAQLWHLIDFSNAELHIEYSGAQLLQNLSYRNVFQDIKLSSSQKIYVERSVVCNVSMVDSEITNFEAAILTLSADADVRLQKWFDIVHYESISEGLQEYY